MCNAHIRAGAVDAIVQRQLIPLVLAVTLESREILLHLEYNSW